MSWTIHRSLLHLARSGADARGAWKGYSFMSVLIGLSVRIAASHRAAQPGMEAVAHARQLHCRSSGTKAGSIDEEPGPIPLRSAAMVEPRW